LPSSAGHHVSVQVSKRRRRRFVRSVGSMELWGQFVASSVGRRRPRLCLGPPPPSVRTRRGA
jgi:hypothetical protein